MEQMRYVYPFLCRIIRREYEPSFERHDAFMKGGKAREKLGQAASIRGRLSDNEVGRVLAFIRRAMLRSERWAKRVYYEDEVPDQERHTTQPDWLDETKAESIAEGVLVCSMLVLSLPLLKHAMRMPSLTGPLIGSGCCHDSHRAKVFRGHHALAAAFIYA